MESGREKVPKSKLSIQTKNSDILNDESLPVLQSNTNSLTSSTPIRPSNLSDEEDSPYCFYSTQEMNDDVDVLWDWNSPQSKPKTSIKRKSKKKLNLQEPTPKVPFRRHASNNCEQIKHDFNKLREELKALKEEIAKPDHEESLVLSPREEQVFKSENSSTYMENMSAFQQIMEEHDKELNKEDFDVFNDDMEEQLIMCSQQVERDIYKFENPFKRDYLVKDIPKIMSNCSSLLNNLARPNITSSSTVSQKKTVTSNTNLINFTNSVSSSEIFNDSFDNVLTQMGDDFDQLTQVVDIKQYKNNKNIKPFPRYNSENICNSTKTTNNKVEWCRSQSFEQYEMEISKDKLAEIEKKRLEAKAKRDGKRRQENVPSATEVSDSPFKCSPEEIEKKRLQALAKLEAKRQQEIIEKKRLEALKRLEENRKKKLLLAKSSLIKRL